ncbi:M14 family zinc carboxypeptidase [Parapedobacter koreensis]|uniref:Zinc carboxypeptidase n=1 Tax=Parapedobacter koreensis TaxID=332977 RepID=A0A1H7U779_9SPHI|nr:M14 family zinc carboxypeptidase [Parapedobacter koreensis]SEL92912.1 Zinc carboxypeptidase [Parapedobacter koreensis]
MKRSLTLLASGVLLVHAAGYAQQIDEVYNQKIKEYTTDDRFLPSSVLNLLTDPNVPSPLKHFGEIVGAPGIMYNTTQIYGYFSKLAETSDRVSMTQVGTTEEGRPIQLIVIADEQTMNNLDHYKAQLAKLADPRKLSPAEAATIIGQAKPIYFLNGGLHSPETGSPHMLMELAYRLATDTAASIKDIREGVITIINPVSEPDGWDKQTDWYNRYTKARTDWDDGMPTRPPYWGKYTVHDNNRDGLQVSQELTKAAYRVYYEWHPTVLLDLHESVPLLYISVGTGPYNSDLDPTTINEWSLLAQYEMTQLAAQGLPGVFTWGFYDGWYPGYLFWIANNHNSIGRFYETFGNAGSNTFLRDIGGNYAGKPATSREWYRPDPATAKVVWSLRNNVNYMQAGVLAGLRFASINSKTLLENFYKKGVKAIEKGKTDTLKAFIIPKKQRDPFMAAYLVNQLRAQAIEVHEAASGANQGDYVVKLDQPYRNLAVSLLTKQQFPKDAEFPPYDDIAWTFGLLYGVDVQEANDVSRYPDNVLKLLTEDTVYKGSVRGNGSTYVIPYKAQQTVLPSLYWLKENDGKVSFEVLDAEVVSGADTLGRGSVVFSGLGASRANELAAAFGLDLLATGTAITAARHPVTLPRIAVFHTWSNTQDEGWTRFTLEQRGIPYTSIDKADLKQGKLNDRFDVILVPRLRGSGKDFIHDVDKKFGPMPYTKTKEYPSHGYPDATDDMTGGPGFDGVANLHTFVDNGGTLITMDNSTLMLAEVGIAEGLSEKPAGSMLHPGSIVQTRARIASSPILYGYPELFPIFRGNGPLLQVEKKDRDMLVLQYGVPTAKADIPYSGPILGMPEQEKAVAPKNYAAKDHPYVISGMVRNEEPIQGEGAVFNVPVGKGRVVGFTFDPLHRYLNHHDAPLVWNAVINWNHLDKK